MSNITTDQKIDLIIKQISELTAVDLVALVRALMDLFHLTDADISGGGGNFAVPSIEGSNTEEVVALSKEVSFVFKELSKTFHKIKATKLYKEFASKHGKANLGLAEIMKKFDGEMEPFHKVDRAVAEDYQKSFAECGVIIELL